MQTPRCIRPLTAAAQAALAAGLRSSCGLTVRRCSRLLASVAGQPTTAMARTLRCNDQTVRTALHAFHTRGLAALQPQSSRPPTTQATCDAQGRERRQALLHQSPRPFGKPPGLWTLPLAAAVSWTQGLTSRQGRGETLRTTLRQMGVRWKRATHWIPSPDQPRSETKPTGSADPLGPDPSHLGPWLGGRSLVESSGPTRATPLERGGYTAAGASAGASHSGS
jgi:hypothetical protein